MDDGRKQHGLGSDLQQAQNWILFWAQALSVSVEVFLHERRSFGVRYLGLQAFVATVLILFFPALWGTEDSRPMAWFLVAYLVAVGGIRIGTIGRRAKGQVEEHSYYSGRPVLMRLFRRSSEVQIKSVLEPVLVLIAGVVVFELNPPLGTYLMMAALGLGISVHASLSQEQRQALDTIDALFQQRRMADTWRRTKRNGR